MSQNLLSDQICGRVSNLPTLQSYPAIRDELISWMKRRVPVWIPVIEGCAEALGLAEDEALEITCTAWFVLLATSGPLDNYVDGDFDDQSAWIDLGRDAGTFVALALICDCFAILAGGTSLSRAGCQLIEGVRETALGQAWDIRRVHSVQEYDEMVLLKSSAIFVALVNSLAALTVHADPSTLQALQGFACQVGRAVQLLNDYRGIWVLESLGKEDGADLQRDGLTYPILYGLEVEHAERDEFRRLMAERSGERDVSRLRAILERAGAETFVTMALAACRVEAASALASMTADVQTKLLSWFDQALLGRVDGTHA